MKVKILTFCCWGSALISFSGVSTAIFTLFFLTKTRTSDPETPLGVSSWAENKSKGRTKVGQNIQMGYQKIDNLRKWVKNLTSKKGWNFCLTWSFGLKGWKKGFGRRGCSGHGPGNADRSQCKGATFEENVRHLGFGRTQESGLFIQLIILFFYSDFSFRFFYQLIFIIMILLVHMVHHLN